MMRLVLKSTSDYRDILVAEALVHDPRPLLRK
jgi:hypothetical protein